MRKTWLLKSEPFKYSWDQLCADKSTRWDGVRNYTARNYLKDMQTGDEFFFYHSNEGKCVVGIGEVLQGAEPDLTVTDDKLTKGGDNPWVVVTVGPKQALKAPVTLENMRQVPELAQMALFKYSRLSVQPVTADEWRVVCQMGGLTV